MPSPCAFSVPFVGIASQRYSYEIRKLFLGMDGAAMCLTFPGKIVAIKGDLASVDYGQDGTRHNINISLIDAKIGSYVLVQGGFAIRVLTEKEAEESLQAWAMIREELQDLAIEGV